MHSSWKPLLGLLLVSLTAHSAPLDGQWRSYARDGASSKYSPLAQIDATTVDNLHIAWRWTSPEVDVTKDHKDVRTWAWEGTPLFVDGVLYVSTSLSQVAAIDAATGKTKWVYDPETWKHGVPANNGFVHRGVANSGDAGDPRIFIGTGDAYLVALDAMTGKPVDGFGEHGRIDLKSGLGRAVDGKLYGISSPPVVTHGVVIVGSKVTDVPMSRTMPPGDVRGFDARTGKQKWQFHTIPRAGEVGNETWKDGSWKTTGSTNVWAPMSVDDATGYVYLPVSTPSDDNYGVHRPGNGLFGETLLCLDAVTGKRVWHFQLVHHGLWDYDPPAAPNLIDIDVNGRHIAAVAQVTKQAFVYVFDRKTGKPVWPIEEKPAPRSTVPGEQSSPTQPMPSKPAAFDLQGVNESELVDFTPELHARAVAALTKYHHGPLYTPPALDGPTILMPGNAGGASWSGAAFDPETQLFYVPSNTLPQALSLQQSEVPGIVYRGGSAPLETLDGVPLWKPPYGRVTAIDMHTGEQRWMSPVGDLAPHVPQLKGLHLPPLGRAVRGHILLTKTLLFVAQEGTTQREKGLAEEANSDHVLAVGTKVGVVDPELDAFDKATGKLVGKVAMPRNATGAPMTYELGGKQFIAIPTGGANLPPELIVFSL